MAAEKSYSSSNEEKNYKESLIREGDLILRNSRGEKFARVGKIYPEIGSIWVEDIRFTNPFQNGFQSLLGGYWPMAEVIKMDNKMAQNLIVKIQLHKTKKNLSGYINSFLNLLRG